MENEMAFSYTLHTYTHTNVQYIMHTRHKYTYIRTYMHACNYQQYAIQIDLLTEDIQLSFIANTSA